MLFNAEIWIENFESKVHIQQDVILHSLKESMMIYVEVSKM